MDVDIPHEQQKATKTKTAWLWRCWSKYSLAGFAFTTSMAVLGSSYRPARFWARAASTYAALLFSALYGSMAGILLRMVGRFTLSQWAGARCFCKLTEPLIGWSFEIENAARLYTRPAVFIANHQSEMDVLMLGRLFPKHCSITAKKSLKYTPILGWFMVLTGAIFINRTNRKDAVRSFDDAVAQMKRNQQSVWIFPEGTRSHLTLPDLLPFKKGAFHCAIQAGVPIIPIVVQNYSKLFNVKRRTFESGTIRVRGRCLS